MTPDTLLTLGGISFYQFEVPESIGFGGEQRLAVHELIGGQKTVDAMGAFSAPLVWSGRFRGQTALERARYVDGLRVSGQATNVTWSEFSYLVVVRRFSPVYERFYEIPYQIECEVIADLTQAVTSLSTLGANDLINGDTSFASGLLDKIGSPTLTSAFASVRSAISAVSDFATAAQSTLNSVLLPVQQFRLQVQTAIAQTNNALVNVATLGGVLPNNTIAQNVQSLTNSITASQNLPLLINLDRVVGRIGINIGSLYSSARQSTVAGGSLMQIAAKEYGDFRAWTGLAKANPQLGGDPQLTGINTITIPPNADNSGGVLNS
ncbi:hypothetical protein [Paraburkholderia atlantica]|uniref:hypothetical protein n=1 Tax=Paraburkholderia atlantica TaxID=2654982 RepID=UPI001614B67B|nr:hypothetical protein [Paraburkholderia atlantica]MBB5508162.1 hypothetical protein [Paraburkholderia atlantica]